MDILSIGPPVTTDIVSGSNPLQGRPGMPGFDAIPLAPGRNGPDGLPGRVGLQHQMDPNPANGLNGINNTNELPLANTANGQNGTDGKPGLLTCMTRTLTPPGNETFVTPELSSLLYDRGGYLSRKAGTDLDMIANKSGTYYIEWSMVSSITGNLVSTPTITVTPGSGSPITLANGFVIANLVAGDTIAVTTTTPLVGTAAIVKALLISDTASNVINT